MIKHFVEYFHPGLIVSDTSTKEIPERALEYVLPLDKYTFGFRFYDRETIMSGEKELSGPKENYSMAYYVGNKKTLQQIEDENDPKNETLLCNMKGNNYPAVVVTKFGQHIPLQKDDIILA